jgi:hypothetical protein
MTNAQLTHYQGLLMDAPRILFSEPVSLNPATLLPNPDLEAPLHDCQEIIAEITQVHPNLQDSALPNSGCHYTFGTIHVHGTIYQERGFITAEGKELCNLLEIQRLLTAVQKPQAVVVVHVPGHQSAHIPEATGNQRVDEVAQNAALASMTLALTLPVPELPRLPLQPEYTPEDKQWIQDHRCPEPNQKGWYRDIKGC